MASFRSPSGKVYQWNKPTPPTQADIDAIVAFDSQAAQQEPAQDSRPLVDHTLSPRSAETVAAMRAAKGVDLRRQMAELNAANAELDPSLGFPVLGDPSGMVPAQPDPTQARFTTEDQTGLTPQGQAEMQGYGEGLVKVAPLIAGQAAVGALPAGIAATAAGGGLLARLGAASLQGGVGGAATAIPEAAPMAAEGNISGALGHVAKSAGIGAVAGPVAGEALRGGAALIRGGGNLGRSVAEMFRPATLTPEQLRLLRSADTVELASGQTVPISLAESINSKAVTRRMGLEGAEPSAEQMDQIYQLALHRAANTPRGARTPQEVSRQVFDILDPQREGIEQGYQKAVNEFSKRAAREVGAAEFKVGEAARKFFPSGRGTASIGEDAKNLANEALESSRADFNAAYDLATEIPTYSAAKVSLAPFKTDADNIGAVLVKNEDGTLSVLNNAGQRKLTAASQVADEVSLDQARKLLSNLSRDIRNAGVLPGVDVRDKARLAETLAKQIDTTVSADPLLKTALGDANKLYRENIGRFKGALSEGILSEAGEAGGLTGERIMTQLTGKNSESALKQFEELLGAGATAGKDRSAKGLELVREAVISTAAKAGRTGGEVNMGKMVAQIEALPDAVRNRLFPNYKEVRNVMIKEAALKGVGEKIASPSSYLKAIDADARTLEQAFGATEVGEIQRLAQRAVNKDALVRKELSGLSLDKLGERNAFDIQKFALDPQNQPKLKNLVTQLGAKNPELLRDVQSLFLDDIMQEATKGGVLDGKKFLELIEGGRAASTGSAGKLASKYHESVQTVLGPKAAKEISDVAKAIADMPVAETTGRDVNKGLLNYLLFGYQGGNVLQGTKNSVVNFVGRVLTSAPEVRYRFAAKFLTDPNLRRLAMTPINEVESKTLSRASAAAVQSIREQFGKDSEQFKDARLAEDALP